MKALSIRQPWAWLIVHGHKDIENRTWTTSFRGRLLVHAGKSFDKEGYRWVESHMDVAMPKPEQFERGGSALVIIRYALHVLVGEGIVNRRIKVIR